MSTLRIAAVSALMLLVTACGGGYSSPSMPSPSPVTTPTPDGPAVSIVRGAATAGSRAYAPDDLSVALGSTVTWTNTDGEAHTSTSDVAGWNSGTIPAGGRFSFAFQTAGTYQYHCLIHPGMVGTVIVH